MENIETKDNNIGGGGYNSNVVSNGQELDALLSKIKQIDPSECIQEAPSDGKTYGRKDGLWAEIVANGSFVIPGGIMELTSESTSSDIGEAVGGIDGFNAITQAIQKGKSCLIGFYNIDADAGMYFNVNTYTFSSSNEGTNIVLAIPLFQFSAENLSIHIRLKDNEFSCQVSNLTPPNATPTTAGYMSAEDKQRVDDAVVFKDVTVAATLTGLSIANYSIKVTLSSASALSFASTPYEGWECMIDIKNTGSSDITQALPNAAGWQSDETSMTIAAGKIASISVRYVHGTYVVLTKGN